MEKNFVTLEVGCWYVTRDGNAVVNVIDVQEGTIFPFGSSRDFFTAEGRLSLTGECPGDLIRKVDKPECVKTKKTVVKKRVVFFREDIRPRYARFTEDFYTTREEFESIADDGVRFIALSELPEHVITEEVYE